VERGPGGLGAHRHGDDLLDLGRAAFADLHRSLDRVRVVRVEVLLTRAIEPAGRRIDPLLDGCVGHLLDEDANLQVSLLNPMNDGHYTRLTDQSIGLRTGRPDGSADADGPSLTPTHAPSPRRG